MSKDLIFTGVNADLPEHLKAYTNDAGDSAELVTGFNSLPSLSIRGKQFRLKRGDEEIAYPLGQPIEVVILAADPPQGCAKAFYNGPWNPDVADMPDCFSADGIKPDGFVEAPVSRSCAECPNNAFGSGTDAAGKPSKGKACSDHKNLFVVEASDLSGDIFVLRVPATSLKSLNKYGRMLSGKGVTYKVVVTSLHFTDEEYPQLTFAAARWVDEVEVNTVATRADSEELQMALPSKNIIEARSDTKALPPGEPPKALAPPAPEPPAAVKYVLTEKAGGATLEQLKAKNWTDELLLEHGLMEIEK